MYGGVVYVCIMYSYVSCVFVRVHVLVYVNWLSFADEAIQTSEFRLGVDSSMVVWQMTSLDNYTRTSVVDRKLCLPISEETYFATDGW